MARPDFVVAGPPEAGGLRLAAMLADHPALGLGGTAPTAGSARATDSAPGQQGELTPYLLADFTAARRLHESVAYPRLLVTLRDPVDRAYAAWQRARAAGTEPLADFGMALTAEPARAAAGCDWTWRYAELGQYGRQLRRLYTLYSPSQVLLVRYSDLLAAPAAARDRAYAFLGVRPRERHATGDRPDLPRATGPRPTASAIRPESPARPEPTARGEAAVHTGTVADAAAALSSFPGGAPPDARARAIGLFRLDIQLLESVTRRPFADWLTGEPATAPRV